MEIKTSEFTFRNYPDSEMFCANETGICLVQYEKQDKSADPVLKKYSWQDDVYELRLPKQKPRNVLRMAHVCRTSKNCYRVSYADKRGCETNVFKLLSEVHFFLQPLWQRSLQ